MVKLTGKTIKGDICEVDGGILFCTSVPGPETCEVHQSKGASAMVVLVLI